MPNARNLVWDYLLTFLLIFCLSGAVDRSGSFLSAVASYFSMLHVIAWLCVYVRYHGIKQDIAGQDVT